MDTSSSGEEHDGEAAMRGVLGGLVTTDVAYVSFRLDNIATISLVLPQTEEAEWGFNEDTLLLGQRFPNKGDAQQAIARYAINISQTYQVNKSNPDTYVCGWILPWQGSCAAVQGRRHGLPHNGAQGSHMRACGATS